MRLSAFETLRSVGSKLSKSIFLSFRIFLLDFLIMRAWLRFQFRIKFFFHLSEFFYCFHLFKLWFVWNWVLRLPWLLNIQCTRDILWFLQHFPVLSYKNVCVWSDFRAANHWEPSSSCAEECFAPHLSVRWGTESAPSFLKSEKTFDVCWDIWVFL